MNLAFSTVKTMQKDGVLMALQRARLEGHDARYFWPVWRSPRAQSLRKAVSVRREDDGWYVYRTIMQSSDCQPKTISMPYILKSREKLLDYQPRAVEGLTRAVISHNAAVDASETGLGKTYTAYAVCRELNLRPGVICRKTGISNWVQAGRYFGIKPAVIVNWEMARTGNFPLFVRKKDESQLNGQYSQNTVDVKEYE